MNIKIESVLCVSNKKGIGFGCFTILRLKFGGVQFVIVRWINGEEANDRP